MHGGTLECAESAGGRERENVRYALDGFGRMAVRRLVTDETVGEPIVNWQTVMFD